MSCLCVDSTGMVATVNVTTTNGAEVMIGDPRNGDVKIEAEVDLPDPCIAPVVFVTSPNGSWFSATGSRPKTGSEIAAVAPCHTRRR